MIRKPSPRPGIDDTSRARPRKPWSAARSCPGRSRNCQPDVQHGRRTVGNGTPTRTRAGDRAGSSSPRAGITAGPMVCRREARGPCLLKESRGKCRWIPSACFRGMMAAGSGVPAMNTTRPTRGCLPLSLVVAWAVFALAAAAAGADDAPLKVSSRALHDGRINPMLFGNFIELLDDLVPGMWAEMLNDRGFEGITQPARWVYHDGSPTVCDRPWDPSDDWVVETTGSFNGPRSARITAREGRAASLTQSGLAVQKGSAYQFSGALRSDGGRLKVQVVLKAALPDGRFAELAVAELPDPPASWTRCTATLEATGTTDQAIFELRVVGQGVVWVDKLSLMSAANLGGWRPDVVAAIRASRPAIIRWGGSAVDPGGYRWKDGIGDRDRRVPFANVHWGRIDPNDVGIDEFCQFCALVAAEPLVCLSFSDGPASAADLVQYCNGGPETPWGARRAANGHAAPYRVKYWQLGNELSGDDDAYIQRCREFIRLMKQADPGVALFSSFPSQKVLDALGKDLAYVAAHHYTRDLAACAADFRRLAGMIARTPSCGHLRVAVTEWNFTGGDWGLMRAKMLTLDGALLNARYLNLLCRS